MMKKLPLLLAVGVVFFGLPSVSAHGDASATGCLHSDNRAAGCSAVTPGDPVSVPEPGSLAMLVLGLATMSGVGSALLRKRPAYVHGREDTNDAAS
jgi:hypothetical protein